MASDVDMHPASSDDIHLTPPSSATTSRRSSFAVPTVPLLVHSPSPSPSPSSIPASAAVPVTSPLTKPPSSATPSASAAPSASASASTSAAPAASTSTSAKPASTSAAKPRSTKHARPRSPSPSPPPPAPTIPLQTIRLQIRLGGPANYEVDIARQAKETGQRPPTPPPVVKKAVADSSESEDEEDEKDKDKDKDKDKPKPKKKKKKNAASEYYDTTDPFIDDSELALDERQFFAQTKQQGFYVSSGEVALLKDKTPKKPKSKKISFATGLHPSLSAGLPSTSQKGKTASKTASGEGTRDAPIAIDAESTTSTSISAPVGSSSTPAVTTTTSISANPSTSKPSTDVPSYALLPAPGPNGGQKRKRQNSIITDTGKRKRVVDETLFHPSLQQALHDMRTRIRAESWENKGKFPPALKGPLAEMAVLAIRLDEYDDDFFSLMPSLFPYNKFTMTKLIKRTVFPDHLALLHERQDVLLAQLKELADEGFDKAKEEWEKSVIAWDRRQEKLKASGGGEGGGGTGTGSEAPTRHGTEEMDVDGSGAAGGEGEGGKEKDGGKDKDGKDKDKEHGHNPPARRYRMTEQMKNIVWELVLLSNECCRLENEKNSLEGSVIQISDQGLRKVLYQKIVSAYPEGWMSSGQISRDVSAMKKRLEKEAMELENDD